MKKEVSLYLDAVRFLAALTVFFAHYSTNSLGGGFLWQFSHYGHQAVTVFFILSGFVIAYATDTRENSAGAYCVSRIARMYSVVVPAVILTAALDALGAWLRPDLYTRAWGFEADLSAFRFFAALTFSNELWTLSVKQGSNLAYWSMGYEVPYYVIFGLALFAPAKWRAVSVGAALLAVGPSIAVMCPVWLAGVAVYRICKRDVVSVRWGVLLFTASLLAWGTYEWIAWNYGRPMLQTGPLFKRAEVIQDYIVACFFCAGLIGFNAAAHELGGLLLRFARPIRWLAGASFTLYLCHLPLARFLLACTPWPKEAVASRSLVIGGTLVLVFMIAAVTERKKEAWRRAVTPVWDWLFARRGVPHA